MNKRGEEDPSKMTERLKVEDMGLEWLPKKIVQCGRAIGISVENSRGN